MWLYLYIDPALVKQSSADLEHCDPAGKTSEGNMLKGVDDLLKELKEGQFTSLKLAGKDVRYHVGGEVLENADLATLVHPKWLNDRIINAYLSILQRQQNRQQNKGNEHMLHLTSYQAVLWKRLDVTTWLYKKVKLSLFTWIFMPINIQDNHWVLLVANVPQRTVNVLDSLGGRNPMYIEKRKQFIALCNTKCSNDQLTGEWVAGTLSSARQQDGCSCGPFVLLNALAILRGLPLDKLTTGHAIAMRCFVKKTLTAWATPPPNQRKLCDMLGCKQSRGKAISYSTMYVAGGYTLIVQTLKESQITTLSTLSVMPNTIEGHSPEKFPFREIFCPW